MTFVCIFTCKWALTGRIITEKCLLCPFISQSTQSTAHQHCCSSRQKPRNSDSSWPLIRTHPQDPSWKFLQHRVILYGTRDRTTCRTLPFLRAQLLTVSLRASHFCQSTELLKKKCSRGANWYFRGLDENQLWASGNFVLWFKHCLIERDRSGK